ncbi:HHIP-like protein 1 [Dermacentor albipictus]|uniref:HHIP-like protein 1 n=1 Tax=Dermacentor albipictus TaxID=60249 RepID=UPI0031FC9018
MYIMRFVCALALFKFNVMCSHGLCYSFEKLLWGLRHPIGIVPLPSYEQYVLVGEHRGIIMQMPLRSFASENIHVFLNLTSKVLTSNAPADERGLLSFVLDPDFPQERSVYVCYSAPSKQAGMDHETTISRFAISGDVRSNTLKAVAEVVLLRVAQRNRRYNGGQLLFGPDRFLYVTTGDDASNSSHRFDLDSFLGKVLRLDVRRRQHYAVPADNPFVGLGPPLLPEVYAYGFRNPWRCTIYSTEEGHDQVRLLCGDTGVEQPHGPEEEEVYLVEAGKRHGWHQGAPCSETCHRPAKGGLAAVDSDGPVFRYSRAGGAQAIVGGVVYGGRALTALRGKFLYADFVHGSLHALNPVAEQSTWISEDLCLKACDGQRNSPAAFYVLAISTDADDEPLILTTTDLRNNVPSGVVYRLKDDDCQGSQGSFHATAGIFGPAIFMVALAFAAP